MEVTQNKLPYEGNFKKSFHDSYIPQQSFFTNGESNKYVYIPLLIFVIAYFC